MRIRRFVLLAVLAFVARTVYLLERDVRSLKAIVAGLRDGDDGDDDDDDGDHYQDVLDDVDYEVVNRSHGYVPPESFVVGETR